MFFGDIPKGKPKEIALWWAARGVPVFPCSASSKKPLTKSGFKDASTDPEQIEYWWRERPDALIGAPCGETSGLVVIDADMPKRGETLSPQDAVDEFRHQFDVPVTPVVRTRSGGLHLYFAHRKGARRKIRAFPQIDILGEGGYVILPPSKGYTIVCDAELVEFPALPKAVEPKANGNGKHRPRYSNAALQGEFDRVAGTAEGGRNDALNVASFNLGQLCASGELQRGEVETALLTAASLNGYVAEHGIADAQRVVGSGIEAGMGRPREVKAARAKPKLRVVRGGQIEPDDDATPDWEAAPLRTRDGLKRDSIHNGVLVLGDTAGHCLEYNEFSGLIIIKARPPWHPRSSAFAAHPLSDPEITRARRWLDYNGVSASFTATFQAIEEIADRRRAHPVRSALRSIVWDGVERLDRWLSDYMGAPETAFVSQAGSKWMIGAVARIMQPGCKVDTMLILEGAQGIKKSTALAALCNFGGESYFTDDLHIIGSKDAVLQLQGVLVVEMAELDAFSRVEVKQIKAFLSRQTDKIRKPYGRCVESMPRQCVFAGTVNPDGSGYLQDPTGGRRFWPVPVADIDLDRLIQNRGQLWAEAVVRFDVGESWWLTDAGVLLEAREEQEARTAEEPLAESLRAWLTSRTRCTTREILEECWKLTPKDLIGKSWSTKAGQVMAKMERWDRKKEFDEGRRSWAYHKNLDN